MTAQRSDEQPRRAIGYIRVSSVGGRAGPEYHTLDIQRASIERVCAARGFELLDVLTDENRSGKSRKRPRFQEAMERTLGGEADAIAVWKVSRFSRNWAEAAADTELLLENGKDLVSGEEGFDTTTTGGRALLRMLFVLATWEHEVLGEGWEVVKAKAVRERGSFLGVAPLGYRSGAGGVLEPDANATLVVDLFTRRAAGATWAELADHLDSLRPRERGRRDRKDVERIITNRAYLGETRWRDELRERAHPALVEPELWDRANTVAVLDEPRRVKRAKGRDFPLSGWLHCCGCGGSMGGSVDRGRHGEPRPNYKCSGRRGGCKRPQSISADPAEEWAMGEAAAMYPRWRAGASADNTALSAALADLADVERALHDLASVEARRELGDDWLPMMRRLRAQKIEMERLAKAARQRVGVPDRAVSWDDMDEAERWDTLRRMASPGALVGPAIRGQAPAGRLAFVVVDDEEPNAVP